MRKKSAFLYYLDVTAPFYYFFLVPTAIALFIVSFDFPFQGLFPTTIDSSISSQHKFLNDYFAICNFFLIGLIVINYLRHPLPAKYVRQIRQHYATLNKNQQSINGWLGIVFFCFTLGMMNLTWFIINDEPLQPYKEWRKGDILTYLKIFAHPYISAIAFCLQYVLIVFITLMFMNVLNNRKYRSN
ncbi:hypothetical protein [Acinetobacter seifertii]|uniref:hypothetical protein n=1 Tax=Acinetobacter seifertii TaxID=1530123 RepID=UPI0032B40C68